MSRRVQPAAGLLAAALLALPACGSKTGQESGQKGGRGTSEPRTIDVPQTVTAEAPGTTPMAQRVAVVGFLNKRNGLSRDVTMKPGQAVRIGDAIIRLRACETTAPWEVQKLTGAFVQLDVRDPQGQFRRVFSGWLYKETPSLNAVEHPLYDVWPKSCAMTHPEAGPSTVRAGSAESSRSRAPNSAGPRASGPAEAPAPALPASPAEAPAVNAEANSAL
jgi:hypothetical protein